MRFENKKVLVIGGAGFIGSSLSEKLVGEGAFVTILDDFFTGNIRNISHLSTKIRIVKGSILDYNLVEELLKNSSIVFNLACRNIILSTKEPRADFDVNVGGMINVLIAAKGWGLERVVFASSASVYGNAKHLPISEDDQVNILNPYAASKIAAESYCMAFYETYEVPITILRYSNVYGVHQSPDNPYCGVVSKFFESAMNNKSMQIHGDGYQTRDFTYVDDVVEATLLAALSPKAVGEVFNVGTGRETSVRELASAIAVVVGKGNFTNIDRRDIDNIRRRVLNIEKIRKYLKWTPMIALCSGLEKTYNWMAGVDILGHKPRFSLDETMRTEGEQNI